MRLAPPPAAAEARARAGGPRPDDVARAASTEGPSVEGLVLDDVDLTDLDVWERGVPYEWLALLRRDAPLHWQPEQDGRGFWVFTRYDDIVAVSKDWETYSSETGGTSLQDLTPGGGRGAQVDDRHRPARAHAPARARQQGLHAAGRQHVRGAHPRARERDPLRRPSSGTRSTGSRTSPPRSRCGSSPRSWGCRSRTGRLLIELGDKILGNTDPEVVGEEFVEERALHDPELRLLPFSSPFSLDLIEYGCRLGEARRAEPRDDITTRLVEAEVDGSRLSEHEFGLFFILLTTAGNETTRHTISLGLHDLLAHPEEKARLVADPSLAGTAADELLRRAHPVHHFRRTATRDVTIHGRRIKAGDKVTIWYAAGNYDEEKFADPYRLDLGRQPNRHLTFGLGGPHFCLGAHLAKLEVKIWLEEMIPYLDRIELAGQPTRLRSNFFNGIKRLPVQVRS